MSQSGRALEKIAEQLAALPPAPASPGNAEARWPVFAALDQVFSAADSENDPAVCDFYALRCRAALAEIRAYRGAVPRLWKFYSSGVVVKHGTRAVMFDLTPGCAGPTRTTRLVPPDDVVEAFADCLDAGFVTHAHLDHMGLDLLGRMLKRGRPVVLPSDAIAETGLQGAIPAEEYAEPSLRILMLGQDYDTSGGPTRIANAVYHYAPAPGVALLLKGDVYSGADTEAIFAMLREENRPLSHALFTPFHLSKPDPVALAGALGAHLIPVHEWEFTHRPPGTPGKATQDYAELRAAFAPYPHTLLAWGESIELSKKHR